MLPIIFLAALFLLPDCTVATDANCDSQENCTCWDRCFASAAADDRPFYEEFYELVEAIRGAKYIYNVTGTSYIFDRSSNDPNVFEFQVQNTSLSGQAEKTTGMRMHTLSIYVYYDLSKQPTCDICMLVLAEEFGLPGGTDGVCWASMQQLLPSGIQLQLGLVRETSSVIHIVSFAEHHLLFLCFLKQDHQVFSSILKSK